MRKLLIIQLSILIGAIQAFATNPESIPDYRGSRMPYPSSMHQSSYPDSLTPVMINHVGRHGARYATSPSKIDNVITWLTKAETAGSISPKGEKMLHLAKHIKAVSDGHWGQLDSIGIAEQEQIATRMHDNYPALFNQTDINAISSYVPRCVMSMYAFCHKLTQLNNQVAIITSSGAQHNQLMRPFQTSREFKAFDKAKPYRTALDAFKIQTQPLNVAYDLMGKSYPMTDQQADDLVSDIYYMISSCSAIGLDVDPMQFFTTDEYRRMWETSNVQQYLLRNATEYSSVPADIASNLVMDLITTTQNFIDGTDNTPVHLRFGHAETIMPLVSLLKLPGCHAPMNCPLTDVSGYWQNYHVIPMAANVQMILFKSQTGNYYLKVELNEQPLMMVPESRNVYIPWNQARAYMLNCIPAE